MSLCPALPASTINKLSDGNFSSGGRPKKSNRSLSVALDGNRLSAGERAKGIDVSTNLGKETFASLQVSTLLSQRCRLLTTCALVKHVLRCWVPIYPFKRIIREIEGRGDSLDGFLPVYSFDLGAGSPLLQRCLRVNIPLYVHSASRLTRRGSMATTGFLSPASFLS
jgi:hypothetical protein